MSKDEAVNNSKEWQDFIETRVQESIMNHAPQIAKQFGLKITPPTKMDRLKQAGFILGVAAIGGAIGAGTALYIKGRRDAARLTNASEFEKIESNGHSRVRPVGSRASALVTN